MADGAGPHAVRGSEERQVSQSKRKTEGAGGREGAQNKRDSGEYSLKDEG